jgi:NADH-quinone oxidoreductase subunit E
MLRGSDDLIRICEERIGEQRHVTADGLFSWLEVECLGACCNAPMVQINDDYFEDLDAANFTRLLDDLAAGRPVHIGPQNGRLRSEPLGGLTALTDFYGADGKSGPLSDMQAALQPANPANAGAQTAPTAK